jgi:predicted RNA-binding protein with PUA-like domain
MLGALLIPAVYYSSFGKESRRLPWYVSLDRMPKWLFKEEPTHFSYADLEAAGTALWDGVENALAQKYLRQVRSGDEILFYHTGKEKAVVGVMVATADAQVDAAGRPTVTVAPRRRLQRPITLAEIKADAELAGWELTRLPRLSIMPVTAAQWRRLMTLSRAAPPASRSRRPRRKDSP